MTRGHFEKFLQQHDAEIDWPLRPHGSIQLKCTLSYSDPQFAQKSGVWPVASRKAFDQCMMELGYDEINTLKDVWPQVWCNKSPSFYDILDPRMTGQKGLLTHLIGRRASWGDLALQMLIHE